MNKFVVRVEPSSSTFLADIYYDYDDHFGEFGVSSIFGAKRFSFRLAHFICAQLRRAGYHSARVVAVHD